MCMSKKSNKSLFFPNRFYVPSITYFQEKVTVQLFFLQAKSLIFKVGSYFFK